MKTHGERGLRTKEYTAWAHMVQRCRNPKHKYFGDYGGRGIKVCERWLSYENFLQDVGRAPTPKHSIDRYPNNDGNYERGNVRWATWSQQNSNKRTVKLIKGKSLTYWSLSCGGDRTLVLRRLRRGWDIEKAINTPTKITTRGQNNKPL